MQFANKLSEPDPFSREEFLAWRAFLRVHADVTDELDRRMLEEHGVSLDQYGILITLVSVPGLALRMGELARIWDSAVPGVVGADVWPPAELRSRA